MTVSDTNLIQVKVFETLTVRIVLNLLSLTKEQLVDIMLELYGASKEANTWLEFYLEPNSDAELEKYKKAIRRW